MEANCAVLRQKEGFCWITVMSANLIGPILICHSIPAVHSCLKQRWLFLIQCLTETCERTDRFEKLARTLCYVEFDNVLFSDSFKACRVFKKSNSFVHWNALLTFHENVLHYHFKLTRTAVALYRLILSMHWIFSSIPFTVIKLFTVQFFVRHVKKSLLRQLRLKIIYQLSLVSPDRFLVV